VFETVVLCWIRRILYLLVRAGKEALQVLRSVAFRESKYHQTAEATDRKPVVTQRGDRIDPLTEVQAKRLRQIQRPEPQHAIDASGDQHLPTEETAETQSVDLTHVGAWVRSSYLTGTEIPDREVPFLRAAGNHT